MILKGTRVLIPKSLQAEVLNQLHYAHQQAEKCKLRAKESVFWVNINADLKEMVKGCGPCQHNQKMNTREPLTPHDVPQKLWHTLGSDIFFWNYLFCWFLIISVSFCWCGSSSIWSRPQQLHTWNESLKNMESLLPWLQEMIHSSSLQHSRSSAMFMGLFMLPLVHITHSQTVLLNKLCKRWKTFFRSVKNLEQILIWLCYVFAPQQLIILFCHLQSCLIWESINQIFQLYLNHNCFH